MAATQAQARRVRVQPTQSGNGVRCPVCDKAMAARLFVSEHLTDHFYGRGVEQTGRISLEITAVIEERQ